MKKIMLFIVCIWFCYSAVLFGITEKFILDHYIELQDEFDVQKYFPNFGHGINRLAKITLRNNTLDGFTVTVHSQNQGNLSANSAFQGETNIPYSVSLEKVSGDVGEGIVENLYPDIQTYADPIEVFSTNIVQSSPSQLSLVLYLTIQDSGNALKMAGDYTDTLFINYTDN